MIGSPSSGQYNNHANDSRANTPYRHYRSPVSLSPKISTSSHRLSSTSRLQTNGNYPASRDSTMTPVRDQLKVRAKL